MANNLALPRRWVFLRGLGRSSGHWGPLADLFQHEFSGDQIELLDLAGNGTEHKRASFWSIDENVDDLRSRCKFVSEGPVNLLTISMGSMVAGAWARKYPHEIDSMVFINTSDRSTSQFYERLRPQNWSHIPDLLMKLSKPLDFEKSILEITAQNLPQAPDLAEQFAKIPMTSRLNWLRQLYAASQFEFSKDAPTVRLLILSSLKDQLVDPACSARLAVRWNAPHFTHPTAGHDLPLVDPAWLLEKVRRSFSGNV